MHIIVVGSERLASAAQVFRISMWRMWTVSAWGAQEEGGRREGVEVAVWIAEELGAQGEEGVGV